MTNYQESPVTGTQWKRASRFVFENPCGGVPSLLIVEETAVQLGERVIAQPTGNLSAGFDPAGEIPLVDPATGDPTGEVVTHGELYALLHSVYLHLAGQRDAPGEA